MLTLAGRLFLGRSSAPQPVPHKQKTLILINKTLLFLGQNTLAEGIRRSDRQRQ
jgi:hypothetical protein